MLNHYHVTRQEGRIRISEDAYDPAFEQKTESLFASCSGVLGVRACFGLPSLYGKKETFLAGLFDRAYPEEVTELVNCPDLLSFRLRVQGEDLSPDGPFLRSFSRSFCPETGELRIRMGFCLPEAGELTVEEKRFASFAEPGTAAQEISLRAEKGRFPSLELVLQANGQTSNEGVSHFTAVTGLLLDGEVVYLAAGLPDQMLHCMSVSRVREGRTAAPVCSLKRRSLEETRAFSLEEGEGLTLSRFAGYQRTGRMEPGQETAETESQKAALLAAAEKGYAAAFAEHERIFAGLWRQSDLRIKGISDGEEAVMALSRYHLLGMMPWGREDCSIASKGLTGEGYKGHVFWDTDLFIQPFFTWFYPEQSRHLLSYRIRGLAGAMEKAARYGYRGAMYPWEAAADGREETPLFAALNIATGKATPVWSGRKEHHVGADIVCALWQYLSFTGDRELLRNGGWEMLFSIAEFWVSRAERDPEGDRLVIRNIIGPDEYTEHIDNNAYTNYMASFTVQQALKQLPAAEEEAPELCRRLKLEERKAAWEEFLLKLYLPEPDEDGIIPQDDTFLQKEQLKDIGKYRDAAVRQTILRDYTREQVNELQVLKQADTVMLLNLFPGLFPPETVRKNVLFYEERTIHDSSLSYCAHAQACAAVGEADLARRYYEKSLEIDWNDNPLESVDGIHAASMGGIWNCVIQGFGGIRCDDGLLIIEPHLPESWEEMRLPLMLRGCRLELRISRDAVEITVREGDPAGLRVYAGGEIRPLEEHLLFSPAGKA